MVEQPDPSLRKPGRALPVTRQPQSFLSTVTSPMPDQFMDSLGFLPEFSRRDSLDQKDTNVESLFMFSLPVTNVGL